MTSKTKSIAIPEKLPPALRPYWRHWNLGSIPYFQSPHSQGTAKTEPWRHTEQEENMERLRAALNPKRSGRFVPAGDYVKLELFSAQRADTSTDYGNGWQMFMSDTPDEMLDHAHPILNARGRVLIHGLGLGCILNCLLHKGTVTHIDVVEVNADVIDLVKPFYQKQAYKHGITLNIHHGSCVDIKWPKGMRWDYVWHDIWSKISADNLVDDGDAEHGISYARLHRMFGQRCDMQRSWAFEMARAQRERFKHEDHYIACFMFEWNTSGRERRYDLLIDAVRSPITSLDVYKKFVEEAAPEMAARYRRLTRRKISLSDARGICLDDARRYANQKVGL